MTKQEYFEACASFDWYYNFSDDHRVWCNGHQRENELKAIGKENGWLDIWQAWCDHMFTGEPWGTERKPRPNLNDFIL